MRSFYALAVAAVALAQQTPPGTRVERDLVYAKVAPLFHDGGVAAAYRTGDVISLFGTGIRGRSEREAVRLRAGGRDSEVLYAGPQSQYAGLDQVFRIPAELTGTVEIALTVDGFEANRVILTLAALP